jgi:hypothetical protein
VSKFTIHDLTPRTGRGVRVAVVDSGVHASHPHVRGVGGGTAFDDFGAAGGDFVDRLGHGTAVAAAIREKAPDVELLAVKVFDRALATTGRALVQAIRWAAEQDAALINLSLGTINVDHEAALAEAVHDAAARGSIVVAAAPEVEHRWLPGALQDVLGVEVAWDCPRDTCQVVTPAGGTFRLRASGYPRPIPGVPPERNLKGISFAVANATGFVALALEGTSISSLAGLSEHLAALSHT